MLVDQQSDFFKDIAPIMNTLPKFAITKFCRCCKTAYKTRLSGREAYLCPACCSQCEEVVLKLTHYFKDHPDAPPIRITDSERIAGIIDAPAVLVWVLAQEGKLKDVHKALCTRCSKDLEDDDQSVCKACAAKIAHTLEKALTKRSETIIKETREEFAKRRYGLGSRSAE